MTIPTVKRADLFGRRPAFYGQAFRDDYFNSDGRAEIAEALRDVFEDKIADRYENCRKSFVKTGCKDRCGNVNGTDRMFLAPETCHCRFCESCARVYGSSWRKKVRPYVESLARSSSRRRFKHVVFNFKNPEVVTSTWVSGCMKIVGKLIRKYCCPRVKGSRRLIGGAIAVLEMSPLGYFHIHCLAYCYYFDHKKMSNDLLELSGDSYRVTVDDASKPKKGQEDKFEGLSPAEVAVKVLNEVTKYISKPVQTPFTDEVINYVMAVKGRRRIHAWGLFYNNKSMKPEIVRSHCPWCGGELEFVGSSRLYDDGETWPVWFVKMHLGCPDLPKRYG